MFDKIVKLSVRNPVFVNLLFFIVIGAGLLSAFRLPREQFPEVSLDRVGVTVIYPNATAGDVEELITKPIEDALEDVADVKRIESTSQEGAASIIVTFLAGKDLQDGRSEVEKAVSTVQGLPEDSETPQVAELKLELPVMAVALLGSWDVRETAERISEELADISGVASVPISGLTERRIVIALDPSRLRLQGVTPNLVLAAVRNSKANVPAGTLERPGTEIFVKTDQRIESAADVASIPLRAGSALKVGDVAQVRDVEEAPDTRFYVNGQPGVQLVVSREEGADPLQIREDVLEVLPRLQDELEPGLELVQSEDYTAVIRDRLGTVAMNGLTGALLVMLVLFVVSGFRQALLALWGMPVSYLFATWMMDQAGLTINVISTFGLLIATGIIVDDAIVVIENTQRHLEMGKSRVRAAIDGTKEVLLPVTVAITTTCLAFLPLTMVGGTLGRVMKILPLVVIFCLLGSLVEAIFILPGHMAEYASEDAAGGRTARLVEKMKAIYRPFVRGAAKFRWVVGPVVFVAFLGVVGLATQMPFQFNAPGKPYDITVTYKLPPGVDRDITRAEGEEIIALVESIEGEHILSSKFRVGSSRDQQTGSLDSGANVAEIRFEFIMSDEHLEAYEKLIPELKAYMAADPDFAFYSIAEPQAGPPSGKAFTGRIRGRDAKEIDLVAAEMKTMLRTIDGVSEVDDDKGLGKETIRVDVDPKRAALYGLTELEVGQAVRTAIDGTLATEVSIDETQVEVVVRYQDGQLLDREGLVALPLTTADGTTVRLDQVAELRRIREAGFVKRRDGQRVVAVSADVDAAVTTALDTTNAVETWWNESIAPDHPGLKLSFGGDTEEIRESLNDLPGAFLLAVGLIYIVLALQFKSYLQPLIILCAVPFGIMGAVLGLFFMGYDLSLFALFGVVALAGIVVNDSLVMVDFINKKREEGMELRDAVITGAAERLRPIISTTLTTCFGLGPLALGLGGVDQILAPMAISIAAGLFISTGLVLVVVPAVYLMVEDLRRLLTSKKALAKHARVMAELAEGEEEPRPGYTGE